MSKPDSLTSSNVLRQIPGVVVGSCVLGVLVGLGTAFASLKIDEWNPELEFKKHADLVLETSAQNSDPNAKAFIENTIFDFGIRDVKEKGQHDFVIRNNGTATLTLEVNRTTCTCTGIDLSTQRLAPGHEAIATVHYNAERATTGPYAQGGTVVTNDPQNREIYLGVKGIFTDPIVLSPQSVFFSNIQTGKTDSATVRIYGFEKEKLVLESASFADQEHFDLLLTPAELSEADKADRMYQNAGSVYEATVTVKPGLPIGTFQEKFVLKTNYPSEPTLEFFVRGKISGDGVSITGSGYNKDTGTLVMGSTTVGKSLSKTLLLQFSGLSAAQTALKVVETKPSWLKTTLEQPRDLGTAAASRRLYSLVLEIPADAPVANFQKSDADNVAIITLETGLPDIPQIKIPVQFTVVGR